MRMIIPFTLTIIGSDVKANPTVVALHEYNPLFDCCSGLNCSWLEVALEMIFNRGLLWTTVLPSGGPSH